MPLRLPALQLPAVQHGQQDFTHQHDTDAFASADSDPISCNARHPNPQLEHLHNMRSQLAPDQARCLSTLEMLQERLKTRQTNAEMFGLDPTIPQLRDARATLERRASFLLASPIAGHICLSVGDLVQSTTLPLPDPARRLLTAQVSAVRQVIAHNNANAIDDARNGTRFCPLSVRERAFADFLGEHETQLRAVVDACAQDGPARTAALSGTLLGLAQDYLRSARLNPKGNPAGQGFAFDGHIFTNAPVSLIMPVRAHSSSALADSPEGECVAILIATDDLQNSQIDPARGTLTSQMHGLEFEQASLPARQAAVFLQKLFLELAHVEEKIYLGRRVAKDGSGLTECARATWRELHYDGSVLIGDSTVAMREDGPELDGSTQREVVSETLAGVAEIAKVYSQNHGESIVADADLASWLVGPATFRDMTTLAHPASRLQLAAMPVIARQLLQTGVFKEALAVTANHDG